LLNNLIIVYGGRIESSSDMPWIFNTVTNQWTILSSAKVQQSNEVPLPRWGHGCSVSLTPGKDSPLAFSLYVLGGSNLHSVSANCLAAS
jgi:hypothetical protein